MEWKYGNPCWKKKFKMQLSLGKVICTVFLDKKMVLSSWILSNLDNKLSTLMLSLWSEFLDSSQKTTFLFSTWLCQVYTSLKTVKHIEDFGWTVLPQSLYFGVFWLWSIQAMKPRLYVQLFSDNTTFFTPVKKKKSLLPLLMNFICVIWVLVHDCWKYTTNIGNYGKNRVLSVKTWSLLW